MFQLSDRNVERYLQARFGEAVRVLRLVPLGHEDATDLKGYGYGTPVRVDYEVGSERRSAVLETVAPGPFGHEDPSDRARILLWSHRAYNRLPKHVRSLDVGGFTSRGELLSVADIEEFFTLNEYVAGREYFHDLERLRDGGAPNDVDIARAEALADYLIGIHAVRGGDPELYVRRLRELMGHHECIAGLLDTYPVRLGGITRWRIERIERSCVGWRWKLKEVAHRLRQVHGDFHPWNILFREGVDFTVLDRSRGEWGDPADDVACLAMNYIFFSLQRSERLEGGLEALFRRFWNRYLEGSGDTELPAVVAPFFAFRALVMASPVWYPQLKEPVRQKLINFVEAILRAEAFDPSHVNEYCA